MVWFWLAVLVLLPTFGLVVFIGAPYVPSQKKYIKQAFAKLYKLSQSDVVVDIGSGDGVVLRQVAKLGAKAIGFEINPILVLISRMLSVKNNLVETKFADFWSAHLPNDVSLVYVFAVSRDTKNLLRKIQNESNRMNREFHLMSYGSAFNDLCPIKSIGAYNLYLIKPLQQNKAQV